ncbi:MAG: NAD(P)-dependent alcohol dehydrogenase [Coriobacteriia bacterium]|nr:NAD(P)-dependent alcohol dehydrogenase [Coriobacteriia bacterium]
MKAVIQSGYGSADVIELAEVGKPTPGKGEVLVRVMAASLAAGDYYGMRGTPFPVRFIMGLFKPKPGYVVGLDFAGVVESVGPDVTAFRPGDEVYGEGRGACAEYAVARADRLAPKPMGLTFEQAAAVPTSGCTAYEALRVHGKVQPGQHVLINGASGGVGTFAVQIAKALGAEVTAVCSTRNVETARSLGADHVIDYTKEDFTQGGPRYDLILDNVGSHSLSAARRALKPEGVHLPSSGHAGMGWIIAAGLQSVVVRQQGAPFTAFATSDNLRGVTELIDAGRVAPLIDRALPLEDTAEAFRYLDTGHARGKVVIRVRPDGE